MSSLLVEQLIARQHQKNHTKTRYHLLYSWIKPDFHHSLIGKLYLKNFSFQSLNSHFYESEWEKLRQSRSGEILKWSLRYFIAKLSDFLYQLSVFYYFSSVNFHWQDSHSSKHMLMIIMIGVKTKCTWLLWARFPWLFINLNIININNSIK